MLYTVHSPAINAFLKRVNFLLTEIITQELRLPFSRTRFQYQNTMYPINLVTFENHNQLAFFEAAYLRIGLHRKLSFQTQDQQLKNILRHEMAHYMTWIQYGNHVSSHGIEFKNICKHYQWDVDVSNARMPESELMSQEITPHQEALINKIKKLLALATSENPQEAQSANLKANELILKYNLQWAQKRELSEDQETFTARVIEGKKISAKERAIYEMLKVFFVQTIFSTGRGAFALEVIGEKKNIEMSIHIADFLFSHLEFLWITHKKNNPNFNANLAARHSFFLGISEGFIEQYKQAQDTIQKSKSEFEGAVVLIEKQLQEHLKQAYPRLGQSRFQSSRDLQAYENGKTAGQHLKILTPIKNNQDVRFLN